MNYRPLCSLIIDFPSPTKMAWTTFPPYIQQHSLDSHHNWPPFMDACYHSDRGSPAPRVEISIPPPSRPPPVASAPRMTKVQRNRQKPLPQPPQFFSDKHVKSSGPSSCQAGKHLGDTISFGGIMSHVPVNDEKVEHDHHTTGNQCMTGNRFHELSSSEFKGGSQKDLKLRKSQAFELPFQFDNAVSQPISQKEASTPLPIVPASQEFGAYHSSHQAFQQIHSPPSSPLSMLLDEDTGHISSSRSSAELVPATKSALDDSFSDSHFDVFDYCSNLGHQYTSSYDGCMQHGSRSSGQQITFESRPDNSKPTSADGERERKSRVRSFFSARRSSRRSGENPSTLKNYLSRKMQRERPPSFLNNKESTAATKSPPLKRLRETISKNLNSDSMFSWKPHPHEKTGTNSFKSRSLCHLPSSLARFRPVSNMKGGQNEGNRKTSELNTSHQSKAVSQSQSTGNLPLAHAGQYTYCSSGQQHNGSNLYEYKSGENTGYFQDQRLYPSPFAAPVPDYYGGPSCSHVRHDHTKCMQSQGGCHLVSSENGHGLSIDPSQCSILDFAHTQTYIPGHIDSVCYQTPHGPPSPRVNSESTATADAERLHDQILSPVIGAGTRTIPYSKSDGHLPWSSDAKSTCAYGLKRNSTQSTTGSSVKQHASAGRIGPSFFSQGSNPRIPNSSRLSTISQNIPPTSTNRPMSLNPPPSAYKFPLHPPCSSSDSLLQAASSSNVSRPYGQNNVF